MFMNFLCKKILSPGLIILMLLPGFLIAQTESGTTDSTSGQTKMADADARKIFDAAVEAAGGKKVFHQLKNFKIKTHSKIFQPQMTIELDVTEISELPDKTKQIMELPAGKRIQVLNGISGWKQLGGKVDDLTSAEKREIRRGLLKSTFYLFKHFEDPNLQLTFLGEETRNRQKYLSIQIKDITGDFVNLSINAASHLVERKTYQGVSDAGLATLMESYSDYRKVDGIMLPFHTEVRANGKKFIDSVVTEAQINLSLRKDFFNRN